MPLELYSLALTTCSKIQSDRVSWFEMADHCRWYLINPYWMFALILSRHEKADTFFLSLTKTIYNFNLIEKKNNHFHHQTRGWPYIRGPWLPIIMGAPGTCKLGASLCLGPPLKHGLPSRTRTGTATRRGDGRGLLFCWSCIPFSCWARFVLYLKQKKIHCYGCKFFFFFFLFWYQAIEYLY